MELDKCINERRSIRKYKEQPVTKEQLTELIKAAQMAPSWRNSQVSRYYVINTPETKEKFVENLPEFNKKRAGSAGAVIVSTIVKGICGFDEDGNYASHLKDGFQYFDNGLQVQNLCLKAYEMGLGTLIMGLYDNDGIRKTLEIPENEEVVAVVAVGYADIAPETPERNAVEDIVKFL